MSKHKHYDMIVAKAANMDLVTLMKIGDEYPAKERPDYDWRATKNCMPIAEDREYFLCLPQHKEACLHWLNGGEVQYKLEKETRWTNIAQYVEIPKWKPHGFFMETNYDYVYRIKPKKVKRWIGVYGKDTTQLFNSKESCKNYVENDNYYKNCAYENWQFIEIEVEE